MSLLVIGSAAFDSIQTPSGSREKVIGGSGVYAAYAASFFTPVRLVSVVGEDWPSAYTDRLRTRAIDLEGLEVRPGARTLAWSGRYFENLNDRETLDIRLNVMGEEYRPLVPESYRGSEFLLLANGSPVCHLDLLDKMAKKPRLTVADTMDFYIQNQPAPLRKLLPRIDGLILNDSEARLLAGEKNTITAARRILEMGPAFVIVKKGENGAFYLSRQAIRLIPAYPSEEVVDPTGAGDSFAGALMGALAASGRSDPESIIAAMARATVVAGYNVEGFSLERLETLTEKEIESRLAAFRTMITF
ncbi:MAG: sugar kinase [Thermoguttaceae bacterium]|nr:sugar kinase [Thermoguttaceae bacterium]